MYSTVVATPVFDDNCNYNYNNYDDYSCEKLIDKIYQSIDRYDPFAFELHFKKVLHCDNIREYYENFIDNIVAKLEAMYMENEDGNVRIIIDSILLIIIDVSNKICCNNKGILHDFDFFDLILKLIMLGIKQNDVKIIDIVENNIDDFYFSFYCVSLYSQIAEKIKIPHLIMKRMVKKTMDTITLFYCKDTKYTDIINCNAYNIFSNVESFVDENMILNLQSTIEHYVIPELDSFHYNNIDILFNDDIPLNPQILHSTTKSVFCALTPMGKTIICDAELTFKILLKLEYKNITMDYLIKLRDVADRYNSPLIRKYLTKVICEYPNNH